MKLSKGATKGAIGSAIKHVALVTAMGLLFATPSLAATGKSKAEKTEKAAAAKAEAAKSGSASGPSDDVPDSLPGQVAYQVLLGEIALQRGNPDLAVSAYADLAARTRDPKVLERTMEIAAIARRFDIAYEAGKLWVEVEPDSIVARQTLTAILIMQNKMDELGPQIFILLEKDKANLSDNLLRLNRMLARAPDKAAVFHMLEKVLTPYAGVAEAHFALGTAAYHNGDYKRALEEVRKSLVARPDWELAVLFESQLLARESPSAGIDLLEQYLKAHPASREVRLHLARGLVAEKRFDEARKHFDRLLADNPESPELIYPVAILALQQDDVATAEPLLRVLFERGEPAEKGVAAFYLGQISEERGAFPEAVKFYRQVSFGEQFAPAQIRVARILVKQEGGLSAAREHLQVSAKVYPPAKSQLLVAEAQLLREAGRDEEALVLLNSVILQQPDQAEALYDAAMLAEKLGRMDVVESNLRRVIVLRPENAHAYNALGYSFAERGIRLDEARKLIAKATELAPEDPFIMDSMGWVLFRQGDFQGALAYLQKAYVLKQDAEIAAHIGEVLWALDRREEAQRIWAEAAIRHPDNSELKAVQQKFKR